MTRSLEELRKRIDAVNHRILELLCERGELVREVGERKRDGGVPVVDAQREREVFEALLAGNRGPFSDDAIVSIFREIIARSRELQLQPDDAGLRVQRRPGEADRVVTVGATRLGAEPVYIAGPCAVESAEMLDEVAAALSAAGVRLLRGGAFKPRSSPYAFQGLGEQGLRLLRETADRYGMAVVSEVMDPRDVGLVASYADLLQVGARNMYNYPLLRELGRTSRPVLLKRAFSATLEEFLLAAEYLLSNGNEQVVLCERGIRTFEQETRNTLDISALPLLRQRTAFPVVADVSHAAGRRDILPDLAAAAFAAGASAVMLEVHPTPASASSDAAQQLRPAEFVALMRAVRERLGGVRPPAPPE